MTRRTRRGARAEGSHERWLVSYADFITLLFAFFVVLFASSQKDRSKVRQFSRSVSDAFSGVSREARSLGLAGPDSGSRSLAPALRQLAGDLQTEIREGKMQVRMEQRGLVVSLSQTAFFPSGADGIDPSMFGSLEKVARAVGSLPNAIRLEGHTDAIPIHTARFRNNWDLSAARAISLMEILRDRWNVPPGHMAITGFGETSPVDSNETEDGRSHNRRVDIVILNQSGDSAKSASAGRNR